jgi:hypothetical protein
MSDFDNIGELIYLQLEKIDSEVEFTESEFILEAAVEAVKQVKGRNWVPLIVQQIEDRYQLVSNQFVYAVMHRANLEKVWCIVIDSDTKNIEQAKLLSREIVPKVNLSVASRKSIEAGLKFLLDKPASALKGLDVIKATNRIEDADRKSWKDFTPITKLACGITKGKKLDALSEVFYLAPPEPEVIPVPPVALSIKKASYDEILTRLNYLSVYKIGGFDKVDSEQASEAIFTASKGTWKSLNPIAKLDCGIDTARVKVLKNVFTL